MRAHVNNCTDSSDNWQLQQWYKTEPDIMKKALQCIATPKTWPVHQGSCQKTIDYAQKELTVLLLSWLNGAMYAWHDADASLDLVDSKHWLMRLIPTAEKWSLNTMNYKPAYKKQANKQACRQADGLASNRKQKIPQTASKQAGRQAVLQASASRKHYFWKLQPASAMVWALTCSQTWCREGLDASSTQSTPHKSCTAQNTPSTNPHQHLRCGCMTLSSLVLHRTLQLLGGCCTEAWTAWRPAAQRK